MILTITLIILLVLIMMDVPIAFSLMASSLFYLIYNDAFSTDALVQQMASGVDSFPLLAIIFFLTAGTLMNYTGITSRLLKFCQIMLKNVPGRLGQVNIILSTLMGGLSGSNIADSAMEARILVPEMEKKGYSKSFATALTASSSLITPIIPPGIALILYGFVGQVSIGKLFMAGIVPGVVICLLFMGYVHFLSKKRGYEPRDPERISAKEAGSASKDAFLALLLPIIIIGGIRLGIFSPTEAGAIAVLYALFLGLVVYREMNTNQLFHSLVETLYTAVSILIIISAASAFAWILTLEQVPQKLTEYMSGYISSPAMFFIVVLMFLFVLGMFIEGNVALIILTPLFMPMLQTYNIDPVHFGIFLIISLSIGTITPPLGTVMFTTSSITGAKIEDFIKEVYPFWIILAIAALIIAFIPEISLWLPNITEN